MSHHVGCGLPGQPPSATVYADYRQPITHVMRRIHKAVGDGKPPAPADYDLIAGWAAANPGDVCAPPFTQCTHAPGTGQPCTPPPYNPHPALF